MRIRIKTRITNPKEIADQLRFLGCTEEQIARHLLPLIAQASNVEQPSSAAPPTATEAVADYSLLPPRVH